MIDFGMGEKKALSTIEIPITSLLSFLTSRLRPEAQPEGSVTLLDEIILPFSRRDHEVFSCCQFRHLL